MHESGADSGVRRRSVLPGRSPAVLQDCHGTGVQTGPYQGTFIKAKVRGYSFRCEHKIFSSNFKRGPSCQEAALCLYRKLTPGSVLLKTAWLIFFWN